MDGGISSCGKLWVGYLVDAKRSGLERQFSATVIGPKAMCSEDTNFWKRITSVGVTESPLGLF